MSFKVPNKYRIRTGQLGSNDSYGCNGAFELTIKHGQRLFAIVSDQLGWEHVSVSRKDRTPTWDEMCQIKQLFWDDEDCVVQYHPPRSEYVNNHQFCLHMWRIVGGHFPMPPSIMVGMASKQGGAA